MNIHRNIHIPDKAVITTKIIENSAVLFIALMVLKVAKATSSQPNEENFTGDGSSPTIGILELRGTGGGSFRKTVGFKRATADGVSSGTHVRFGTGAGVSW